MNGQLQSRLNIFKNSDALYIELPRSGAIPTAIISATLLCSIWGLVKYIFFDTILGWDWLIPVALLLFHYRVGSKKRSLNLEKGKISFSSPVGGSQVEQVMDIKKVELGQRRGLECISIRFFSGTEPWIFGTPLTSEERREIINEINVFLNRGKGD